jgi:2-(1,2-epoxy-1,2-dihydrophenyl)acetyl-CoA isomerase
MDRLRVTHARQGATLTIALERDDKLNALDDAMTLGLQKAFGAAERDPEVRCVILIGRGRGFCAGQDLDVFRERYLAGEPIDIAGHLARGYNLLITQIRRLEKPVIAAVNGIAAGVGVSLALACDVRIASEAATFTLGFSRIGLIPDGGGSLLLPMTVGLGRAYELAATSERIDASEALRFGLVNRVVPAAGLEAAAQAFGERLNGLPAVGLALTKRAFNCTTMPQLESWLAEEAQLQQRASESADHREGVLAFLEKRRPAFTGK